MKIRTAILLVLVFSVFLVGCSSQGSYSNYNQPQQQQGQYVGGGCGVAPSAGYANAPIEALNPSDSNL